MKRCMSFAWMGVGLVALSLPALMTMPLTIVYNPSDSAPRGWYRIGHLDHAKSMQVGGIVLATIPADAAALAARRGYLPTGVPILKRIGAVAPQSVCVREHTVYIDGAAVATVRTLDGMQRPLPVWRQCRVLADNELFLLGVTHPASFDSRYFGPIATSAVVGIARPIWTWRAP
jgi:conjugative transfer signal peptidase TraF